MLPLPGTPPHTPQSAKDGAFAAEALPYLPDVVRFARSLTHVELDADDLVQETFLRAYQSWHTYRPGSDCRRWLFTICKHEFLHTRRREQRYVDVEGDAEADTLAAVMLHVTAQRAGADDLFARLDLAPAIRAAIDGLPHAFRAVVLLVDVEGYEYEEAAGLLDVPVGTVRSRLFRARRLLQESLFAYARDAGLARDTPAPAPEGSAR
jgi:RNA polymerase sigma-70 factor (ECF subfamily)